MERRMWGLAWYWYAAIFVLLIPCVMQYGLGVTAGTVSAVLVLGFVGRFFGLAWYWYAVILGPLIPWMTMYRDMRDAFDDGLKTGLGVWLGVSAVTAAALLGLCFLLRLVV